MSGQITNKNNEPLAYANVHLSDTRHGTYSDLSGDFSLGVKGHRGQIVISHIGYLNDTIFLSSSIDNRLHSDIQLIETGEFLDPITVNATAEIQKRELGLNDNPVKHSFHVHHGYIVAGYIKNDLNKDCTINKLKTRFYHVKYNPVIRYRFFKPLDSDGIMVPGEEVNYQLPLYQVKKKKFTVDVSSSNIIIPVEGLIIGVELISGKVEYDEQGHKRTYPSFRYTDSSSKFLSWSSFMKGKWSQIRHRHTTTLQPLNVMIGADVVY